MFDALRNWSGEPMPIGFGEVPGVVVVDFQTGFTRDPDFLMNGAPLIDRAVENTARLLRVARAHGVPVASCYTRPTGASAKCRTGSFPRCGRRSSTATRRPGSTRASRSGLRLRPLQGRGFDFLPDPRRRVLRQGTGRHGHRHRLRHQRLHSGERDRQLSVQVPHHGAGGLRRRSRGGLPLEQPARHRPPLLRCHELRRGHRLPRDPTRQEPPITPGATPSRTRDVGRSPDTDRKFNRSNRPRAPISRISASTAPSASSRAHRQRPRR